MRSTIFGSIALAAALVTICGDARAQSFPPSGGFTALQKGGANVADANDVPVGQSYNDVVGDATNAAVQIGADANFLYFRLRLVGAPTNMSGYRSSWGCVIDSDGVSNTYEYLAVLDGANAAVRWRANTSTITLDSPSENADAAILFSGASGTYATNSGTGPYVVDFAIPWNQFPQGPSVRFACGSGNGTNIGIDPVAGATANASATLTNMWSTPYVCTSSTGCRLDTDGDSIPDVVETLFGTDPTLRDTDGDGLSDTVELTPAGGGAFAKVDTDGDGTIDARDLDSDNDCRPDAQETALTFRDATAPNTVASSNCASTTPICNTLNGTCTACAGDQGAGAGACYLATFPACQTSGALAGACTVCRPGLTGNCTSAALSACESTTGTCAACNGDNGSNATAVCPSAATPACQTAGALTGKCTVCSATNLSLCTTPTAPTCDSTGTCAACDGDHAAATAKGCPTTTNPYCILGDAGASVGSCGKCTSNADCGAGHAGPTCDLISGACVDKDSDGDGLNDSVELVLGTDRDKKDTDGDGIDDFTEVRDPQTNQPKKVDTDNDGVIDALDLDSDNDGVPDAVEGTADLDSDIIGNWRDPDDDGDGIPTATEIDLANKAGLSDDVDQDGKKNYYDTDADGDGKGDKFEGTGDDDGDGIPNFLDSDDHTMKPFDAGPPITPAPTSPDQPDASVAGPTGPLAAPDDGVIEGNGFACSTTPGGSSGIVLFGVALLAITLIRRRR